MKLGETLWTTNSMCENCESCQNWVALQNYNPKSPNTIVTTARLLFVARACQGNHIEMPQSATVAIALHLITESTGVVPFCQCLTLCTVTGRHNGGTGRQWAAACWGGCCVGRRGHCLPRSKQRALCGSPRQSWGWGHSAGDSKGIFPL